MSALVVPLICLPISSQPVNFANEQFVEVRDVESADSGEMNDNDLLIVSYFYWGLVTSEIKRGKQEGLVG